MNALGHEAVDVVNAEGASPFVILCDHASNAIPAAYGDMGLTATERASHIAWDPGALDVSRRLAELLDAPLIASNVSRLVIDANRDPDAPNLIWTLSEATRIAANENLPEAERQHRVAQFHRPYHDAVTALLDARDAAGQEAVLVCLHSFTPVFLGVARPWQIGLIHGRDEGFTRALGAAIAADAPGLTIGWNEPYSAMSGVTYTLEHHGDGRALDATMLEIRNDEIQHPAGVEAWAARLVRTLVTARDAHRSARAAQPAEWRDRSHA